MADADESPAAVSAFFVGHPEAATLFAAVRRAVESVCGPEVTVRVSKSQVAFARARTFAAVWRPGQYLDRGAPLVLSVFLRERDQSPRWKEVVQPAPGRFTHHLELHAPADVDAAVRHWLRRAWEEAA